MWPQTPDPSLCGPKPQTPPCVAPNPRPLPVRQQTSQPPSPQVDLMSGEGLPEAFQALGPVHAVINCAALSQPAVCEKQPEAARWGAGRRSGRGPGLGLRSNSGGLTGLQG